MKFLIPKVIEIVFKLTDNSSKKVNLILVILFFTFLGSMGRFDRTLDLYLQKKDVEDKDKRKGGRFIHQKVRYKRLCRHGFL